MGVRWSRYDPWEREQQQLSQRARDRFEQRVTGYLALGWTVVERQEEPLKVRLAYQQRRSENPQPSVIRDNGDRVIWIDDAGEVQVGRGEFGDDVG